MKPISNIMENENKKFVLPSPVFKLEKFKLNSPHFASPEGMLLPREEQPPPMFGPKGTTIPAKYLEKYKSHIEKYNKKSQEIYTKKSKSNNHQSNVWCENCDMSFTNHFLLEKHISEYKNCPIDGCRFKGCFKFLEKHIEELHTTGLYNKIKNLNTPEEIAKWRNDRRKNYPTTSNVLLRQKAQEERKKRGEVLEKRKGRFGNRADRKKMNNGMKNELKRKNGEQNDSYKNRKKPLKAFKNSYEESNKNKQNIIKPIVETKPQLMNDDDDDDKICNGTIPRFKGTSYITDYNTVLQNKVTKNVLSGLLGMYGESSESDNDSDYKDEPDNDKDIKRKDTERIESNENLSKPENEINLRLDNCESSIENATEKLENRNLHSFKSLDKNILENGILQAECDDEDNDDMPDEVPIMKVPLNNYKTENLYPTNSPVFANKNEKLLQEKHSDGKSKADGCSISKKRSKVREVGHLLDYSKLNKTPQNTLLEKLLEPQIRHERNILLQCVKYVVTRNFFEIGEEKYNTTKHSNKD